MGDISPDPSPAPYLHLHGLTKVYAGRDGGVRALDQVSLSGERGAFISIVGPSGCGKSTLMMIAAGLMPPSSGVITIDGKHITTPRTDIGMVFQNPVLLE
jgi:NitT/TauT family transport system ATP-binding protein